jgi:glycine cleavage system H lipoate-binding protein
VFPGVDGFHWTFGHVLFLTIFFGVLLVVGITVVLAALRSSRRVASGAVEQLRWRSDFEHLSAERRACRHELAGKIDERCCANRFDCCQCSTHPTFGPAPETQRENIRGLDYPAGRLYHRGHTWIERQEDGTVLIGLDELASRVVGQPDRLELPPSGARLQTCGAGWRMWKRGYEVRVLAPVAGEVLEAGGPEQGWYLRLRPDSQDFTHLLRGGEVEGWVERELEWLQASFAPGAQATLADGGVLVRDLMANMPEAAWDEILGHVFLEP